MIIHYADPNATVAPLGYHCLIPDYWSTKDTDVTFSS